MARPNYGPQAKKRAKRLLEALLAYANNELENCDHLQIQVNWQTENHLVVRTKVRFLEELTVKDPYDGRLNNEQIKEALKRFEDFLEILEDNRATTRGAENWHFTLKLWHRRQDKEANLKQFDVEWERRRPERSKQVAGEEASVLQTGFANANQRQDWGEAVDASVFYERTEELTTVSRNVTKHRLLASQPQLLVTKDLETFQGIVQGLIDEYQPETATEHLLIQQVAMGWLRLHRLWGIEVTLASKAIALENLELFARYEKAITTSLYDALDRLSALRQQQRYCQIK